MMGDNNNGHLNSRCQPIRGQYFCSSDQPIIMLTQQPGDDNGPMSSDITISCPVTRYHRGPGQWSPP